jgi:hypothetical protein
VIFVLMIVGIVAWSFTLSPTVVNNNVAVTNSQACTDEAKICPDGSAVGRTEVNCAFAACPVVSYISYLDAATGASFEYPSTWKVVQPADNDKLSGILVSFINPHPVNAFSGNGTSGNTPYLTLSRYKDMNSFAARGGSWMGMRTYTSLADFFTDRQAPKQTTGMTIFGGMPAYDVNVVGQGTNYAVMAERPDGIYQFDFTMTANRTNLTEVDQHIISSFRFKQLPS